MDDKESRIPRVLTIAGSDSGAGAGIQADLKTFAALGVYGMTAVTSITSQNTLGVQHVYDLPAEVVESQIQSVFSDMAPDAVKIGMLSSAGIAEAVYKKIRDFRFKSIIIDPVMKSSSGASLLSDQAVSLLKTKIFPCALAVTPNLDEASELTGKVVKNLSQMRDAARAVCDMGPRYVVVKGGHLDGDPVDLLFDGSEFFEFSGKRIHNLNSHGTGCTLDRKSVV